MGKIIDVYDCHIRPADGWPIRKLVFSGDIERAAPIVATVLERGGYPMIEPAPEGGV